MREVLEAALAPELATSLMFQALKGVPRLPKDRDSVIALCRGPLTVALRGRVGDDVAAEVLARIERVLMKGDRTGTDIPIEIDLDDDVDSTMMMPVAFRAPVSVVVVSSKFRFAERLVASLGDERVYVTAAMDARELRKNVFAAQPLLVVVDATAAPAADDEDITLCLKGLPDRALGVVWGADTDYGKTMLALLQATGSGAVGISQDDGIEPLLDLVLSRYGGE